MLLLAVTPLVSSIAPHSPYANAPQQIIFPIQTLVCGALLLFFWRRYDFGDVKKICFATAIAILVFVIWISPQALFHIAARRDGFDPTLFQNNHPLFVTVLSLRFVRLVIVVPLLEEIFWRGFLLRELVDRDFEQVPFGTFSLFSFTAVSVLFALAHSGPEFVSALVTGAAFNFVAYRTRSLASCFFAHAATNLLLGIYVMQTRQWGFW